MIRPDLSCPTAELHSSRRPAPHAPISPKARCGCVYWEKTPPADPEKTAAQAPIGSRSHDLRRCITPLPEHREA